MSSDFRFDDIARRVLDIGLASAALVVSCPFLVVAAALIKLQDGGSVIYRRRVLGQCGTEFNAYKLRTMRVDADTWVEEHPEIKDSYERVTKLQNDPRVTPIGAILRRFHLDEIPQFLNVIRGQMTLVGPRMVHPSELARFGEFSSRRLSVKPGMTGLWQITIPRSPNYEDRIALDRRYLDERSLWLDLSIMIRTIPSALKKAEWR